MKLHSLKAGMGILLPLLLCFQLTSIAQAPVKKTKATVVMPASSYNRQKMVAVARDTTPVQRAFLARKIKVNPHLLTMIDQAPLQPPMSEADLGKYLEGRKDCDIERSIDSNNCVLVKYPDGLIKKICDGKLTEIVTPDGNRHIVRINQVFMYVPKLPPPQVSSDDPTYVWLASFNNELLKDIQNLLSKDKGLIDQYLQREGIQCKQDVFRQVVYRMTFMENFLVTN